MLNLPLLSIGAALLAGATFAAGDDTQTDPRNRHARPPVGVPLVITEGMRVVAADADDGHDPVDDYAPHLFARLTEAFPGRFTEDDDGVWHDGWPEDRDGAITWDDEYEVYWEFISAERLTAGRQDFVQFCSSCHAFEGDGFGRSGQALRPPPRDFTQGMFKFTKVNDGRLPDDDTLVTLIQEGLDGTPMHAWGVSEARIRDIVTYIKSLGLPADEDGDDGTGWRDPYAQISAVIDTPDDPWAGRETAAVTQGERIYHKNQCYSCHPAYVTPLRTDELREVDAGTPYPETHTYPKLKEDSSYEVLGYAVAIVPPDFTWHTMRRGKTVKDIYQTVAAGIPGAGMPTWIGGMPDEDIWAIAHYVRHLVDEYKGQDAKRTAFMRSIR